MRWQLVLKVFWGDLKDDFLPQTRESVLWGFSEGRGLSCTQEWVSYVEGRLECGHKWLSVLFSWFSHLHVQSHLSYYFSAIIIYHTLMNINWFLIRSYLKDFLWEFTTQWCSRRWVQCWGRWSWCRCRFQGALGHSTHSPGSWGIQLGDPVRR